MAYQCRNPTQYSFFLKTSNITSYGSYLVDFNIFANSWQRPKFVAEVDGLIGQPRIWNL